MTIVPATPIQTAEAAWGAQMPDWVRALALACEASSQAKVAKVLKRSGAVVSQVLRNCYPADTRTIEELVRGALMGATVDCPALQLIERHVCVEWRGRARAAAFSGTSTLNVQMFRACNRCPRFTGDGEGQDD